MNSINQIGNALTLEIKMEDHKISIFNMMVNIMDIKIITNLYLNNLKMRKFRMKLCKISNILIGFPTNFFNIFISLEIFGSGIHFLQLIGQDKILKMKDRSNKMIWKNK